MGVFPNTFPDSVKKQRPDAIWLKLWRIPGLGHSAYIHEPTTLLQHNQYTHIHLIFSGSARLLVFPTAS